MQEGFCPTACLQCSPTNAMDDETYVFRSKRLELYYGLLAFEKPELQNVWDSYVIFLELENVFRNKQRLKDM